MGDLNLIPGRTDESGRIGMQPTSSRPRKAMLSSPNTKNRARKTAGSGVKWRGRRAARARIPAEHVLWVLLNVLEFDLQRESVDAVRTILRAPDRSCWEGKAGRRDSKSPGGWVLG